jgi:RNA polymerase sigma-70 factor (ECF subfamily)
VWLSQGALLSSPINDGDATLVFSMARGDRDALATLYDRYATVLLAVGMRILGDRREAEDLLHDVFLDSWRRAGDYDAARGSVRTWLILRMRSRALDRRRAVGFARVVSIENTGLVEDREAHGEDVSFVPDRMKLHRALQGLPPEQRRVLELGYFEGLSSSEISVRLEAPIGTIKSRVAAALSKLRAGLSVTQEAVGDASR